MGWIINLTAAILLTELTGSTLLICWYFTGRILDKKGYLNILYPFLKLIAFFFLCPVSFLVLWIAGHNRPGWGGVLFRPTPTISIWARAAAVIWGIGSLIMFVYCAGGAVRGRRLVKARIRCDRERQELFERVCRETGVAIGKVTLCESYQVPVPMITGLIHPVILLPAEEYTEPGLRMILIHELVHYRHRDLWLKAAASLILVIGWFNPFVWLYCSLVERWTEYACDYTACGLVGDTKEYFEVILKMAQKAGAIRSYLSASLFENTHELVRRVSRMAEYRKLEKPRRTKTIRACLALLLISIAAVLAVSLRIAALYQKIHDETISLQEESGTQPSWFTRIAVTVPDQTWVSSGTFAAEEGQSIVVNGTIWPSGGPVKIGISGSDGETRYIEASEDYLQEFSVTETDTYSFIAQNSSGSEVEITGYIWCW
ncbi:MAG: M56 family metallopeptidase [Lachnospiraceae bacterium]|nr:M56 family metallopeptidase [Lachnospiraceae bacterium]MCD7841164.1 M56 family metallopeptidase [Lachnospiraceae bacterium]